jgi:hypothetical protein
MTTDAALTQAYHSATSDYETAKARSNEHLSANTELLVAETMLTARLGYGFDARLKYYREHYSL